MQVVIRRVLAAALMFLGALKLMGDVAWQQPMAVAVAFGELAVAIFLLTKWWKIASVAVVGASLVAAVFAMWFGRNEIPCGCTGDVELPFVVRCGLIAALGICSTVLVAMDPVGECDTKP